MKGFRTLAFNFVIALAVAALHFAAGVDWTEYVSPSTAVLIVTGANALLRFITTSPVGVGMPASAKLLK